MLRRALPLTLTAALLLTTAACGGGDDEGSAATTAPPTTEAPTTTAPADPFAVPDQIDEAYVERVINELYRVVGDATRIAVTEGTVTASVGEHLQAVMVGEYTAAYAEELMQLSIDDFADLHDVPGDITWEVYEVLETDGDCLAARANSDNSAVARDPVDFDEAVVVLQPAGTRDVDPVLNRTPWVLDRQWDWSEELRGGVPCEDE